MGVANLKRWLTLELPVKQNLPFGVTQESVTPLPILGSLLQQV